MNKTFNYFFFIFLAFSLVVMNSLNAQPISHEWHSFLGSSIYDWGEGIAADSTGNIYSIGRSDATWGTPVNAHAGGRDGFVAKLDSSGSLLWNTFMGSAGSDECRGITLDGSGNIYVVGFSPATWGSPVNAYAGDLDAFVAKLDSSGNRLWHTFLGCIDYDVAMDIVTDSSGNIFVIGNSDDTWGSPINPFNGDRDVFVAKLNSSGNLQWNTFMGSSDTDFGRSISLDSSGNIFVAGESNVSWGTPVNVHSGDVDMFVACLNSSGALQWNTFLGCTSIDNGYAVCNDGSGNLYATGFSFFSWGSPVNPHAGDTEGFVAKLDSSGNLLWNTFLGSANGDNSFTITASSTGRIYVAGVSYATWGSPVYPYSGGGEAFVAGLDGSGNLKWNTFLGSSDTDWITDIALDASGSILVTGTSYATWGMPVNAHSGNSDAFVARLVPLPETDITANGSDGPISINQSDTLQIRVSLDSNGSGVDVDYWLAYKGPSGWVHFNNSTKKWEAGLGVTHQGPLVDLNNKKVFQSKLTPGNYTFYFGVDMDMNGKVTKSSLYKDEVQVTVTQ